MDKTQDLLHILDERIAVRVEAIREGRDWWRCKRGCDHCCRHLANVPALSAAEWQRVDHAVAMLPDAERALVEQKITTLLQQISENTIAASVVCPFLNEQEGLCRIYAARPIACRTYGYFVARDHDQYCQQIEQEIHDRKADGIVWGNAEAVRQEVEQISGAPIPFEEHYGDR